MNELPAALQDEFLHHWRDKACARCTALSRVAVALRWRSSANGRRRISPSGICAPSARGTPKGENIVVRDTDRSVTRSLRDMLVTVEPLCGFVRCLSPKQ